MMGRIIALDMGSVRIGVAVSDPLGVFAQGIAVLPAEGPWMRRLEELMTSYAADRILVGFPRRTSGEEGPEARRMMELVALLRERFPGVTVETEDERFTTVMAHRAMREGDASRGDRRRKVDGVAAALLLQGYLDRRRNAS
ncbi:MAG TPA: Holliday junction resolvase RuvX [Synergistaceae bacterium]|nr:Holliday junction resolvase RuvX [Synergistaceae bacterium]